MARNLSGSVFATNQNIYTMLNRATVLDALIRHETLSINDIRKPENLGLVPEEKHLQFLLDELTESKHITLLASVTPHTYTITDKGIEEGNRLKEETKSTS